MLTACRMLTGSGRGLRSCLAAACGHSAACSCHGVNMWCRQLQQLARTSVKQVERLSQRSLSAADEGLEGLERDRGCGTVAVRLFVTGLLQHSADEGLDVRDRKAVRSSIQCEVLLIDVPLAVMVDGVKCPP